MDIQRGLEMIERQKIANRNSYIRRRGIIDEVDIELKNKMRAENRLISYERQKQRQRQQRIDRGLKQKGRPFLNPENKINKEGCIKQLEEFCNIFISMD